jgi:hypothetical protein|nr:MAG TPA: hypothetical protein [Caudoviricetes sp.]
MEDIKVRDYVRTFNGEIFKIVGMKRNKGLTMYLTDSYSQYSDTVLMQCAKAHSKQIEELIEKGDIIKYRVNCRFTQLGIAKEYTNVTTQDVYIGVEGWGLNQIEIIKIYTKEEFEMMGYEVV